MELVYSGCPYFEGTFAAIGRVILDCYPREKINITAGISPQNFSFCAQPDYFYRLLGIRSGTEFVDSVEDFQNFVWSNIEKWRESIGAGDIESLEGAIQKVYGGVARLSQKGLSEVDIPRVPYKADIDSLREHPARYNMLTDTVYVDPFVATEAVDEFTRFKRFNLFHKLIDYLVPLLVHADTGECEIYAGMREQLDPLRRAKPDTEEVQEVRKQVSSTINSLLEIRERLGIDILEEALVYHFRTSQEARYTGNRDVLADESRKKFLKWAMRRQASPPHQQPNRVLELYAGLGRLLQQEGNLGALRKAKEAINDAYSQREKPDVTVFSFFQ